MPARLNIFQKTMLRWNEMHPYNAVHVARVPQPLETERLETLINGYLERCGLTNLSIDSQKGTFHYDGGPAQGEIKVIKGEQDSHALLRSEIEEQLNTPFVVTLLMNPFRFFVIEEGDAFYLGLVYFHIISGAEPIVFILKDIVNIYMNRTAGWSPRPLDLYPSTYRHLARVNLKSLIEWVRTLPALISGLRRSYRPRYSDVCDAHIGFSFASLGSAQFDRIVKAGKLWDVTLNDIFLALLMKSLSCYASGRFRAPRRKNISVASIVNIRKDFGIDTSKTFGLFLGSFFVSHSVSEGIQIKDLARDIHLQTREVKRHRLYLRSAIEMALAQILFPLLSPLRQKKFYPKYYPLFGGITNINLNTLWYQEAEKRSIDYVRAVSTGPAVPLVFSITTIGDVLNIGASYKTAVYSKTDIEGIISDLSDRVNTLGAEE
jgi:hypothetical protein